MGRTNLDDDTYAKCIESVRAYFRRHQSITNKGIRALTSINYDQAIKFFARAVREGVLERRGRASGTHYVPHEGRR